MNDLNTNVPGYVADGAAGHLNSHVSDEAAGLSGHGASSSDLHPKYNFQEIIESTRGEQITQVHQPQLYLQGYQDIEREQTACVPAEWCPNFPNN